ncbi:MAG: pyrroline-5-carboxylate reductase [Clostridiales bacterium]|nr:pyrroline-5-carboxylate reductase [Clostridiales bacterium]
MGKKISFIGSGNMGGAIISGIAGAGLYPPEDILAADPSAASLDALHRTLGIQVTQDNREAAAQADILFLAVKPGIYAAVIPQIRDFVHPETLIVSIAAGQTIAAVEKLFEKKIKLIRVMPNTPALVGAGMASISPNGQVSREETLEIKRIFDQLGKAEIVDEKMIDVVTGISGSSPAYVYMFIEAMADAAVAEGMSRASAYEFCAQAVLGSAKMVLETGKHPGELKDMVCSPGGTTIAAVCTLEEKGLRSAVIDGTLACIRKSREMSQGKV